MPMRWQDHIADPEEKQVFEALSDPNWDFRTIQGIAGATKINSLRVSEILKKYQGTLVRKSSLPDKQGRDLFTLRRDSQSSVGEALDLITIFASKTLK